MKNAGAFALAGQCELHSEALWQNEVYAPVKPATFKSGRRCIHLTVTASLLYGLEYTHRSNRRKQGGDAGLTGEDRQILTAFFQRLVLVVEAIYTPSNVLIQQSLGPLSYITHPQG